LRECSGCLEHFGGQFFLERDTLGNAAAIAYQQKLQFTLIGAVVKPTAYRNLLTFILGKISDLDVLSQCLTLWLSVRSISCVHIIK
jgi:hypothetical protein